MSSIDDNACFPICHSEEENPPELSLSPANDLTPFLYFQLTIIIRLFSLAVWGIYQQEMDGDDEGVVWMAEGLLNSCLWYYKALKM